MGNHDKPVKLLAGGNPQIPKGEGDAPVQVSKLSGVGGGMNITAAKGGGGGNGGGGAQPAQPQKPNAPLAGDEVGAQPAQQQQQPPAQAPAQPAVTTPAPAMCCWSPSC